MKNPTISVIIPCYNHGQFVEEAIDSVLASDFTDFEIIVVDDGSTDPATIDILNKLDKPKTRVIRQENRGVSVARNTGIEASTGKYFLPLDADDTIEPSYLSEALKVLEGNAKLGFAYSWIVLFGQRHSIWKQPKYNFYRLLWHNHCNGCALVRKQAWADAGGYNPNMRDGFEDWDFWISLGKHGWHGQLIRKALFNYRRHIVSRDTESRKKTAYLIAQIRQNHSEIYGDRAKLSQIRREWGVPIIDIDPLWPLKMIWRAEWFPDRLRTIIRPLPKDRRYKK